MLAQIFEIIGRKYIGFILIILVKLVTIYLLNIVGESILITYMFFMSVFRGAALVDMVSIDFKSIFLKDRVTTR